MKEEIDGRRNDKRQSEIRAAKMLLEEERRERTSSLPSFVIKLAGAFFAAFQFEGKLLPSSL
jgi:hypothetical protein